MTKLSELPAISQADTGDDVYIVSNGVPLRAPLRKVFAAADHSSLFVNVVDLGADPTGVADSAPAIRAAMGSDRVIFFPAGEYLLASMIAPLNPHFNPNADHFIDAFQHDNWAVFGYGATLVVDGATNTAGSTVWAISECSNWRIYGLKVDQDIPDSGFSSGFGIVSCINFHVSDVTFGPALPNQAFYGNYMVDGLIENTWMERGQFGDFANIIRMSFNNISADGNDDTPAGLFLGIAGDPATDTGANATGISISESEDIKVTNCRVTGYNVGALIREGKNYLFSGNTWYGIDHASVSPIGIYILYTDGAVQGTSVGHPPRGIIINNETFSDLGVDTPGIGIFIDASAVTNADVVEDIVISNVLFDNVDSVGIGLQDTGNVANLVLGAGLTFTGASNPTKFDFTLLSVAKFLSGDSFGFSYPSGTFGSVTQLVSKATTVVHNRRTGEITMHNAQLDAGTIVSFTLGNSVIGPGDNLLINHVSGGTLGAYSVTSTPAGGGAIIHVRNNTGGNLSEAIVLKYTAIGSG